MQARATGIFQLTGPADVTYEMAARHIADTLERGQHAGGEFGIVIGDGIGAFLADVDVDRRPGSGGDIAGGALHVVVQLLSHTFIERAQGAWDGLEPD